MVCTSPHQRECHGRLSPVLVFRTLTLQVLALMAVEDEEDEAAGDGGGGEGARAKLRDLLGARVKLLTGRWAVNCLCPHSFSTQPSIISLQPLSHGLPQPLALCRPYISG